MKKILPAAGIAALLLLSGNTNAAVIVTGNALNPSSLCTITITHDILLTVTAGQSVPGVFLVFDNWLYGADTHRTSTNLVEEFRFTRSGHKQTSAPADIYDNMNTPYGDMASLDGAFRFDLETNLLAGEKMRIKAGTYTFYGKANFSPHVEQTFSGQVFLADGNGTRLSGNAAVPEPSVAMMAALAGGCFLRRRRAGMVE